MTADKELRKLAEAATPGPWIATKHGVVVGGAVRVYENGCAQDQLFMCCVVGLDNTGNQLTNAAYIAAANPGAVIELLDTIDRLTAERDEFKQSLHGWIACNAPGGWIDDLRKERDAYKLDAARQDAERLDWFENENHRNKCDAAIAKDKS